MAYRTLVQTLVSIFDGKWVFLNPFRAPEPLPVLNASNLSPETGFQL